MKEKRSKKTKWILLSISFVFIVVMLVLPLIGVLVYALKDGIEVYLEAVADAYTIKALKLTVIATVAAVFVNTVFGVLAAWAITRFHFKGKNVLTTLIDLPFAISPVIAGLMFALCFGRMSPIYDFLQANGIKIVFAVPGIILATIFVTFPFVSREIIPVLNAVGKEEEEAAALMGASGFHIFRKITLPNMKWGLLYGIVLCTARAMGEFGAVSVISGHLRGKTNTLPLQVEITYNEFKLAEAFAISSILVILAIVILLIKTIIESKARKAGGLK